MPRLINQGWQGLSSGWLLCAVMVVTLCVNPLIGFAQAEAPPDLKADEVTRARGNPSQTPDETTQLEELRHAAVRLPLATGLAYVGTNLRLGESTDVRAVAEMSDGTLLAAKREVKVTVGGCGG